ncbi:MAG: tetratricopeptide repeat protein [Bacteroidales bacterium]|nr:tetratricopeptide repeat protein [Bacteroidales bacterium]MCK9449493.1 tetratricopeptide repeat protein [Bacteroidales bacterium]MDD3701403.1 tetratricopeptide repeat protein [Bacteroidales bacterium]MDY0369522.1 tetratricopeptide repeat protein [Bacteroidales bacterium]
MNKNILLILWLIPYSFLLTAQNTDYYDLQDFPIMSPVQSSITHALGWSMQDNGTWAYADNKIPFTDSRSNADRPGGLNAIGQDNFISIEMHKIMLDNEQYNVLVKKYHDGEFEFPYLQRNWRDFKSLDYYIFRSEKLKEMLPEEVPFNTMYLVDMRCYMVGTIKNYEESVFMGGSLNLTRYATKVTENFQATRASYQEQIIRAIQQRKTGKVINDGNLIFAVYPIRSTDKEKVRIKFIKGYMNDNLIRMQTSPDNWKHLFSESFYEVDYSVYSSFINQSLAYYVELDQAVTMYDSHYNWGVLRYQIGDYVGALEAFNKAFAENPDTEDFMFYAYRGNTRSKMGLQADAIADFDKAIALQPKRIVDYPNWVRNYFNRGVAKYYLNNGAGACEDWKKAYDLGYGSASEYLIDFCGQKFD